VNILQGLVSSMQHPQIPMHTGEAFFIWRQYVSTVEGKTLCQTLLNHTSDPELKSFIREFLADSEEPHIKELADLMRREGIEFPSLVTEKTQTADGQIPAGARFTDEEACHLMIGKLEMLMFYCYMSLTQTLRDDLGLLFSRYLADLARLGLVLKKLAGRRGWLMYPPPFAPAAPH
jgi:hypothetical protein